MGMIFLSLTYLNLKREKIFASKLIAVLLPKHFERPRTGSYKK